MEHGIIQQMQKQTNGDPYNAISTVNIIRAANKAGGGQTMYLARLLELEFHQGKPQRLRLWANGVYDLGEPFVDSQCQRHPRH